METTSNDKLICPYTYSACPHTYCRPGACSILEVAKHTGGQPTVLATIDLGKNGGVGEPVTVEFLKAIGCLHFVGDMYECGSVTVRLDSTWWFCIDFTKEKEDSVIWRPVKDVRHLVDLFYDIDIKPHLQ